VSEVDVPRGARVLPPVYFLVHLLAMAGLHLFLPVARWIPRPLGYLGIVPALAGVGLAIAARMLFARQGTTIRPFEESSALVVTGPYRLTRNPMYLGMTLVLIGEAVWLGTATPWLVLPMFLWLITTRFIRHEEAMLEQRFGAQYREYKSRVRRWV